MAENQHGGADLMPSSYTTSERFTLQATGENNNTWGVILNSGVFQLVDDAIAGRVAFSLSGAKVLTTVLGATDEARMAFLDVTGGSGGTVTIPAVSKGYFVRNAAAGQTVISAGGATNATFEAGDIQPVFSDGSAVYPLMVKGKTIGGYVDTAIQGVINYVNVLISQGSPALPGVTLADVGKALIVRNVGGTAAWVPSPIQTSDVQGLDAALAATADTAADLAVAFALTL